MPTYHFAKKYINKMRNNTSGSIKSPARFHNVLYQYHAYCLLLVPGRVKLAIGCKAVVRHLTGCKNTFYKIIMVL